MDIINAYADGDLSDVYVSVGFLMCRTALPERYIRAGLRPNQDSVLNLHFHPASSDSPSTYLSKSWIFRQ